MLTNTQVLGAFRRQAYRSFLTLKIKNIKKKNVFLVRSETSRTVVKKVAQKQNRFGGR